MSEVFKLLITMLRVWVMRRETRRGDFKDQLFLSMTIISEHHPVRGSFTTPLPSFTQTVI